MLLAQQKITVVSNIKVSFSEKRGTYRWYKPVFAHEGSTLMADSADYNQGDNYFDAYGNVVITQPNGTVVYADKLHYTESTQQAILTNNVRLIDREAILTTNNLTYDMNTKIGRYVNNGQIINGKDTLNSTTGSYFESTQDAYFRKNVVVKTPDVKIYTDTMRYNSASKITYFYGPTNIKGKNGNLYTENGDYNTETDKAKFGKNNLYTEGSKFLWGDSLVYDGVSGNGRAVKNVHFVDTAQQIVMRGQLGTYTKATQTTVITENAYLVLATKSDSTASDSTTSIVDSSSTASKTTGDVPKTTLPRPLSKDSIQQKAAQDTTSTIPDSAHIAIDSLARPKPSKMDSTYMSADTLISQVIQVKDFKFLNLIVSRDGGEIVEDEEAGDNEPTDANSGLRNNTPKTPSPNLKTDSLKSKLSKLYLDSLQKSNPDLNIDSISRTLDSLKSTTPDSLSTDSLRKNLPDLRLDSLKTTLSDTITIDSLKKSIPDLNSDSLKKPLPGPLKIDSLKNIESKLNLDSLKKPLLNLPVDSLKKDIKDSLLISNIPKQGERDSIMARATETALNQSQTDSLATDTTETRIVIAYHNVKIFKSDLQAIADSAYFGYPDSIIRSYGSPMIWSQGSQLSADTTYLQLKNQKLDNVLLLSKAFIASTELDSSKYNQVKGRKISGFFSNDKLDRVFVDGNAESIYYTVEEGKFTSMLRSISSRIKVLFSDNKMTDVISIRKPSSTYYPIELAPEDKEFLDGFIWKPELRPKSKEEVIQGAPKKEILNPEEKPIVNDSTKAGSDGKKSLKKETSTNDVDGKKAIKSQTDSTKSKTEEIKKVENQTDSTKAESKTKKMPVNTDSIITKPENSLKRDTIPALQKKEIADSAKATKIDSLKQVKLPPTQKAD